MSDQLRYRPEIDGMRAIAILLVCIFHFQLLPIGKAGFIGVDVFFVISGFLITQIIVGSLDQNSFSLGTFYYRRIRRQLPPGTPLRWPVVSAKNSGLIRRPAG